MKPSLAVGPRIMPGQCEFPIPDSAIVRVETEKRARVQKSESPKSRRVDRWWAVFEAIGGQVIRMDRRPPGSVARAEHENYEL